ncbi:hypothetical protein [Aquibacillus salsiterrae]|uniref:Uncharacterized protein n=1 Tax=Aquibacillus salsiterrae TaxID=2950439 RepID=A0A9X3WF74_9BACI|nr:hypothetical protein [Aquibacillus salsiterrae]MDC3418700.1 hypothetical protein [Aquibacillus salsiterrae]
MQVISLENLLRAAEESEVRDYLSSFSCEINPGVEDFLKNQAIESEKRVFTRTHLVIDEENNGEIIGYFSLKNKSFDFAGNISGSLRQKIAFSKKATTVSTILIAQLGRSDAYKGVVSGSNVLELALEKCEVMYKLIGMRVVCVEYEPVAKLEKFYSNNSFQFLQYSPSGYKLAFIRLS